MEQNRPPHRHVKPEIIKKLEHLQETHTFIAFSEYLKYEVLIVSYGLSRRITCKAKFLFTAEATIFLGFLSGNRGLGILIFSVRRLPGTDLRRLNGCDEVTANTGTVLHHRF